MLKEQIRKLFDHYDPAIQEVISAVLTVEQEHISMQRPRVKTEIDSIVTRVAEKGLARAEPEGVAE